MYQHVSFWICVADREEAETDKDSENKPVVDPCVKIRKQASHWEIVTVKKNEQGNKWIPE